MATRPRVSDGAAVSCREVSRDYQTAAGTVHALVGIDAQFYRGQVTAVVGPSGSGKSTLLRILAAVDRPTSGYVQINRELVWALPGRARWRLRRHHVGYLFQNPADNLISYLTAAEHVALGARLRGADSPRDVADLLDQMDIGHRAGYHPAQLSSGEQQLVAFAAAVAGGPAVVIADEPTAELDDDAGHRVISAVGELRRLGVAVVVATHDDAVLDVADRVLRLRHGVLEGAT